MSSLISRVSNALSFRSNPFNNPNYPMTEMNVNAFLSEFGGQHRSDSGEVVNHHTAMYTSTVLSCVKIISEKIATTPLFMYQLDARGNKELAVDHDYFDLVTNRPNPEQDATQFRTAVQVSLLLWGNGYIELQRDNGNRVAAMWHRHPSRTEPVRMKDGTLMYRTTDSVDREDRFIKPEDMIHLMGVSFDGYIGLSPIMYAKQSIGANLAMDKYGARFFANNALPQLALITKQVVKPEDKTKMRQDWESLQSGRNQHRVAILDQDMSLEKLSISQDEAQFLQSKMAAKRDVASIFSVPGHMVGDVEKGIKCLPADSLVLTVGGPKKITDVVEGEYVWGFDGNGLSKSRVLASVCSGSEQVISVRTQNRLVRMTGNHRVLARVPTYTEKISGMGGRNGGDGKKYVVSHETRYVFAKDLKVGDTLVTLGKLTEQDSNTLPTGRIATAGFMEFCGLLLSDGNLDAKAGVVHISRGQDANYMDHYRDIMRAELGARTITEGKPNCIPPRNSTKFVNRELVAELVDLGLSGVCRTKSVPDWVFGLSDELKLAFIRGYLDGDGTVNKQGRMAFISVNRFMLEQIRHLCMTLGIPVTNLTKRKPTGGIINGHKVMGNSPVFLFTCSCPSQNARVGSNDARYVERFANGKPFSAKEGTYPRYGGKDFNAENVTLSRIASIAVGTEAEKVYDLQVEGTESFVADGVVVHNSNVEQQAQDFLSSCLEPWMSKWEKGFTTKLFSQRGRSVGRYIVNFDKRVLLMPDSASKIAFYQMGIQNGIVSPNEARTFEGLNSIGPAGDQHYIQLNMQTLENANATEKALLPPDDELTQEQEANSLPKRLGQNYRGLFKDGVQRVLKSNREHKAVYRCLWPTLDALSKAASSTVGSTSHEECDKAVEKLIEGMSHRAKKWSEEDIEAICSEEMLRVAKSLIFAAHADVANAKARKVIAELENESEETADEQAIETTRLKLRRTIAKQEAERKAHAKGRN